MKKRVFFRIFAVLLAVITLILHTGIGSFAYYMPDTGYKMSGSYLASKYYSKLASVKLTGDQRTDIAEIAKSQLGYHEGSSGDYSGTSTYSSGNYTEYNRYAYSSNNAAWCGSFISWCAAMAGIPTSVLPKTAAAKPNYWKMIGTGALEGATAKTPEDLVTNGGTYIPKVGDLAFFGNKSTGNAEKNSCSHVGLITEVNLTYENGKIVRIEVITTEGNYSDKVTQNDYVFDAKNRDGHAYKSTYLNTFGVPNYQKGKAENTCLDIGAYGGTVLRAGASGKAVQTLQFGLNLTAVLDGKIPSVKIDGNFDSELLNVVKKFQSVYGLSVDGLAGKDTWGKLRSEVLRLTKEVEEDLIVKDGKLYAYKGVGKNLTLPESVKTVGTFAFQYANSLTEITLSTALKRVENDAFGGCSSLKKVIYSGTASQFTAVSVGGGNEILSSSTLSCAKVKVTFTAEGISQTVTVTAGSKPSVPAELTLAKKGNALYDYEFAGWRMNGILYKEVPTLTVDGTLVAEFVQVKRVLSVETLNSLLSALAEGTHDVTEFDFLQDGILNVDDLNQLLILLSTEL